MPIYEYKCPKCGTFEVMQGIKEPSLKRCPTCKSKVDRLISHTSFVLKGSGWYATDYARKSDSSSSSSGDSGSSDGSKASESKKDASKSSEKSSDSSSDKSSDKPSAPAKAATAEKAAD